MTPAGALVAMGDSVHGLVAGVLLTDALAIDDPGPLPLALAAGGFAFGIAGEDLIGRTYPPQVHLAALVTGWILGDAIGRTMQMSTSGRAASALIGGTVASTTGRLLLSPSPIGGHGAVAIVVVGMSLAVGADRIVSAIPNADLGHRAAARGLVFGVSIPVGMAISSHVRPKRGSTAGSAGR